MHSTPVAIARPKLSNSSAIASASPTEVGITPGGSFFRLSAARSARFSTSPSGWPFSSISKLTLRSRS